METMEQIWKDLKARKIRIKQGLDILRWGHLPKGSFTIKEAYSILATKEADQQISPLEKIWNPHVWPKISTFLWLLFHKRILTWDNLQKKNF